MTNEKNVFYEKLGARVCASLMERGIDAFYSPNRSGACDRIAAMIPAGSVVGLGGSVTLIESGLLDRLRALDVRLLDRYREGVASEEVAAMRLSGLTSDVFIASVNAVTTDGRLISEDGLGNRVASMIFGPKKVFLIVGVNKVVHSLEEGLARIKQVAAPMNSLRFNADTPCARTGLCDDPACRPPNRICGQIAIIESNMQPGRITVSLVGEPLGF
jgi:hypothetical protein